MDAVWKVRVADGVLQDLLAQPINPLVLAVLNEWFLALCRRLEETAGYPADVFVVHTVDPALLGTVFEGRIIALYTHRRHRSRTWRTLWLQVRERREIVITWLFVLPG